MFDDDTISIDLDDLVKDSIIEWEVSTHYDYDLSCWHLFDGERLRKMFKIMKMIGISLKFSVKEFVLKVL